MGAAGVNESTLSRTHDRDEVNPLRALRLTRHLSGPVGQTRQRFPAEGHQLLGGVEGRPQASAPLALSRRRRHPARFQIHPGAPAQKTETKSEAGEPLAPDLRGVDDTDRAVSQSFAHVGVAVHAQRAIVGHSETETPCGDLERGDESSVATAAQKVLVDDAVVDDDAVGQSEDVNIVYIKGILHGTEKETKAKANFLDRVKNQILHYRTKLDNAEKRLLELLKKGESQELDASEEEEIVLLDGLIEKALDKESVVPKIV